MSAVIFFGQPILAKQLDSWQLLPRPERVTEFYFFDFPDLSSASSDRVRTVEFTVHNLEHQTVGYRYTLSVMSAKDDTEQTVGSGSFTLDHDRSVETSRHVTLPPAEGRVAIKAKLEYESTALGDRTPSTQVQSIHYWTTVTAPDKDEGNYEGV